MKVSIHFCRLLGGALLLVAGCLLLVANNKAQASAVVREEAHPPVAKAALINIETSPTTPQAHPTSVRRVVAIGDIHGSMKGLRGAFRAARLMDEQGEPASE
jgi:hypothetical protein